MSGKAVVESIAKNVAQLIGENRRLRDQVTRLTSSQGNMRDENRRLAAEKAELERRLTIKELAEGFAGGNSAGTGLDRKGNKIARARVNRLMREVDKCIALLNR